MKQAEIDLFKSFTKTQVYQERKGAHRKRAKDGCCNVNVTIIRQERNEAHHYRGFRHRAYRHQHQDQKQDMGFQRLPASTYLNLLSIDTLFAQLDRIPLCHPPRT